MRLRRSIMDVSRHRCCFKSQRHIVKGGRMRMEVIENGKAVPKELHQSVVLQASDRFRARNAQALAQREERREKFSAAPLHDGSAIARLVHTVEARIVEAVWTERRLPGGGSGGQCGISYLHERSEIFANAVANGDWQRPHPGSPPPKSIDRMHEPLSWLGWLSRDHAAIVRAACRSKEGNPGSNVGWGFVRNQVPTARELTIRTLQRRYDEGLRTIAMKLAFG